MDPAFWTSVSSRGDRFWKVRWCEFPGRFGCCCFVCGNETYLILVPWTCWPIHLGTSQGKRGAMFDKFGVWDYLPVRNTLFQQFLAFCVEANPEFHLRKLLRLLGWVSTAEAETMRQMLHGWLRSKTPAYGLALLVIFTLTCPLRRSRKPLYGV